MTDISRDIERLAGGLNLSVFAHYNDYVKKSRSFEENLLEMLREQNILADNERVKRRIRYSGFPYVKNLDTFDSSSDIYPHLNRDEFNDLKTCRFIDEKANIVAIGPSGVGKTHAALAIGYEAIKLGYGVRFKTASNLINEMSEAKSEKSLANYTKTLNRCQLLIIDEVGYLPHDTAATGLLFQIISARYETASTVFTTNYEFSKWAQFIEDGDGRVVSALVSRIAHHAIVLNMNSPRPWRLEHARSRPHTGKIK
jgi:DNA replication protein DnaC